MPTPVGQASRLSGAVGVPPAVSDPVSRFVCYPKPIIRHPDVTPKAAAEGPTRSDFLFDLIPRSSLERGPRDRSHGNGFLFPLPFLAKGSGVRLAPLKHRGRLDRQ